MFNHPHFPRPASLPERVYNTPFAPISQDTRLPDPSARLREEDTIQLSLEALLPLDFAATYADQQAAATDPALHSKVYHTLRGRSPAELEAYENFAREQREQKEATRTIAATVIGATTVIPKEAIAPTFPATSTPALEAPQDTPEVEPRAEPLFAGGWGEALSPRAGHAGFGVTRYDPKQSGSYFERRAYDVGSTPEEDRISPRVRHLLDTREFARTGELAPADVDTRVGGEHDYYQQLYKKMGVTKSPGINLGTTLVRVDGYSVLALGIDLRGDNRGQLSFAAKGNLSQREILRRAREVFPEVFEQIDKKGLSDEPRQIIDLPPKS